jgi:hypothetical protein
MLFKALDTIRASVYIARGGIPVLVYQMGKVGSTSVHRSLLAHGVRSIHLHRLRPDELGRQKRRLRGPVDLVRRFLTMGYCRRLVRSHPRVRVIALVREPISRQVSAFFQNFRWHIPDKRRVEDVDIDELVAIFGSKPYFRHPARWFESEMEPMLGIDVYDYAFPKERGYLVIRKGNLEVLILKLEMADADKERAIAEFLGLKDFHLSRTNVSREKSYAAQYEAFKRALRLPRSYVDGMCADRYTRHFYTDDEIAQMRERWQAPESPDAGTAPGDEQTGD